MGWDWTPSSVASYVSRVRVKRSLLKFTPFIRWGAPCFSRFRTPQEKRHKRLSDVWNYVPLAWKNEFTCPFGVKGRVCMLQNATWLVPALLHAAVAKETKADGKDLRIDTIIIERLYYKLQEFNHYAWIKNVIAGIQKMKHKRRNSW